MSVAYLVDLAQTTAVSPIGGKAQQLRFLQRQKVAMPRTFVCLWTAYEHSRTEAAAVRDILRAELTAVLDPNRTYAVRSSANVEDGAAFSFAGQFETVLEVRGVSDVLAAIETVWASAQRDSLRPYLARSGMKMDDLRMALIIQEMAAPVFSGVAFSKNPLTGLDELIVEVVHGRGDRLVQDGVTPYRWVYKWGDWLATPDKSSIPLELIASVVGQTQQLAAAYGAPIDLEWIYDGTQVQWVQLRPISSLQGINIYSNRISREVLPGMIKPLVWSVNVPLVNSAWIRLFTELIGRNDIEPQQLSRAFHYRAYFNMGVIGEIFTILGLPRESLELMMGIYKGGSERPSFRPGVTAVRHLPRMARFAWDKLRFARRIRAFLPQMRVQYDEAAAVDLSALDERGLLRQADRLFALTEQTAYFNIVTPLLMQFYNARLKRQLAALDVPFDRFDLTRGMDAQLRPYDPNHSLAALHAAWRALPPAAQQAQTPDAMPPVFQAHFNRFVQQFGHLSESGNDFSAVPWRENPGLVLRMTADYVDPAANAPQAKKDVADLPLSGRRRRRMQRAARQARHFLAYREAVGFLYTYGYGLFRPLFLALGARLAQRGVLSRRDDIFYLYLDEVRALVENGREIDAAALVTARRAEMEAARDAVLPEIIYGDEPPPLDMGLSTADVLHGTPTAGGYYQGPVRVIRGSDEFSKMTDGAVLVIPFSDVGWTPLFTRAGAVIAESGGMLSHSSIVAREYHIPAVVSVNNACRLLADDQVVAVDGYKGEVLVINELSQADRLRS